MIQGWPASGDGSGTVPELQQHERQQPAEDGGNHHVFEQERETEPQRGRGGELGIAAPDPTPREEDESHRQHQQAGQDMASDVRQRHPIMAAIRKKPTSSAIDRRFEMVMLTRSLAAANAIAAGNRPKIISCKTIWRPHGGGLERRTQQTPPFNATPKP